jgi:protein tyrosine/serine phosphatase
MQGTYWVSPHQLLAGEYPGEVEPELTKKRLQGLLAAGIRTFIDLTEVGEAIPSYRSVLRRLSEEDSLQTAYANIPIEDGGVPSHCTMRCILDVIDRCIADESPVFVHCWAGLGRTGTVVGCYLKRHGITEDSDVMQKLSQLRKDLTNSRKTSPQTNEQIRMVTTWKNGV